MKRISYNDKQVNLFYGHVRYALSQQQQQQYMALIPFVTPKKVLNGKFHNTRPVERPRIRWEDAVQKNALQILGTRGWRRRAEKGKNGGNF